MDAAAAAKLGGILARKGLTPEEAAAVVRDHVEPVLDEAMRRVEAGEDPNTIEFGIRTVG
jgi:hypothetical protein